MYRWSSLFLLIVFHCPNLIISWKTVYYYISDKVLQASYSWGKPKFLNVSHIKADYGIKCRIKCKQLIAIIIERREEEKLVNSDRTEQTSHFCFPYCLAISFRGMEKVFLRPEALVEMESDSFSSVLEKEL